MVCFYYYRRIQFLRLSAKGKNYMRQEDRSRIENQLQGIPAGQLTIISHSVSAKSSTLLTEQFSAATEGKGKTGSYSIYPGIEMSGNSKGGRC